MKKLYKKYSYLFNILIIGTIVFILSLPFGRPEWYDVVILLIFGFIISTFIWSLQGAERERKRKLNNHKHSWKIYSGRFKGEGRIFVTCDRCRAIMEWMLIGKDKVKVGYWKNRKGKEVKQIRTITFK
jgi:hypothetical protein